MALSADIYSQVGRGVKSVADYDNERMQGQQNRLQLALGQAQFDEYGRKRQQEEQLRGVYAGLGADSAANYNKLLQVSPELAGKYQKNIADVASVKATTGKAEAEADKARLASGLQKFEIIGQLMGGVRDQASYEQALQQGASMFGPDLLKNANPVYNPQEIEAARLRSMPEKERLEQEWKAKGYDRAIANDQKQAAQFAQTDSRIKSEGAANRGVTMRGQNISRDAALQGGSVQIAGDGSMVVVPNKIIPGQSVQASPVMNAAGQPMKGKDGAGPKVSAEVQRQIGGVVSFDKDLTALEEALKDFNPRSPVDQANTTKRARIQSLSKQAQLSAKEAAALGALSGPDMALLEGILNDPTNIRGAISGGAGIRAQISEARAGNQRRVKSLQEQYGDKATAGINVGGAPASAGVVNFGDLK